MAEPCNTGRCLCGRLTYQLNSASNWTALCHCESCRRATSAPVVAWMGFSPDDVIWSGARAFYQSSAIATRGFCPTCGTQMSFESSRWPGEIHLYAVSLDDPSTYVPQLHCHYAERLSWLQLADVLPRYPATSEHATP